MRVHRERVHDAHSDLWVVSKTELLLLQKAKYLPLSSVSGLSFFNKIHVYLENNLNTVTVIAFTSVITNFLSYEFWKLPEGNPIPQKKLFFRRCLKMTEQEKKARKNLAVLPHTETTLLEIIQTSKLAFLANCYHLIDKKADKRD